MSFSDFCQSNAAECGPAHGLRTKPAALLKRGRGCAGLVAVCAVLSACSSQPPVPDWSLSASDAAKRAMGAQLEGVPRVAELEWSKARSEVAKTGQPAMMARLALMRCAMQVASLDWDECSGYAVYAQDATLAEQAYHRFLYGALQVDDVARLPIQHQSVGTTLAQGSVVAAAQLQAMSDSKARLVAAGAALHAGRTPLEVLWPVVDATATQEGWRRALMAWMELERRRLQTAGAADSAAKLERRLQVLRGRGGPGCLNK